MGFLSAIGSFISTVGSAIVSGISSICSTIGGALKTAAVNICNFAQTAIEKGKELFPQLSPFQVILDVVGGIVSKIAELLGIKKENEDEPEVLGMKAEESDMKPEDFDSTQDYINYLHEKVEVDEVKRKELTPEQRAAYSSIGSSLYLDASAEKLGLEKGDLTAGFILDCAKVKMEADEIVAIINKLKEIGLKPQNVSEYLHNSKEAEFENKIKTQSAMMEAFKEIEPQMTDDQIAEKISEMRDELSQI